MMVVTGPKLCTGDELAESASQALGQKLEFENISEYVNTPVGLLWRVS
jgi:hypothetical protein